MSNAADQTTEQAGEERKLTARERREKALAQLKERQKKLEAQLQEDVAKEEKKNFLPLGRVLYGLCMDKKVDLSDPEKLREWVEAWCELGMACQKGLKALADDQRQYLLKLLAPTCTKESTGKLLAVMGYKNGA